MPPDRPRGERASLAPSPSPVTLHYSPATLFLNENPVCSEQFGMVKGMVTDYITFHWWGRMGRENW